MHISIQMRFLNLVHSGPYLLLENRLSHLRVEGANKGKDDHCLQYSMKHY